MATYTTLARGQWLSGDYHANTWAEFLGCGEYTQDEAEQLEAALMQAQVDAFNALLPGGCRWTPGTSEITGPVDTDLDAALDEHAPGNRDDLIEDVMAMIAEQVGERAEEIEREVLGR